MYQEALRWLLSSGAWSRDILFHSLIFDCCDGGNTIFRNVDKHIPDYTTSYPRRLSSLYNYRREIWSKKTKFLISKQCSAPHNTRPSCFIALMSRDAPYLETISRKEFHIFLAAVEPSPLLMKPFVGLLCQFWMIHGCGSTGGTNGWQGKKK